MISSRSFLFIVLVINFQPYEEVFFPFVHKGTILRCRGGVPYRWRWGDLLL